MALAGISHGKLVFGGLIMATLASAGCVPNAVPIFAQQTPAPKPTPEPKEGLINTTPNSKLLIEGTVYGPADLSPDATIVADSPDISAEIDLGNLFRVAQASGPRKIVQNAAITLKGYDWKVVPLMPTKVSGAEGKFKFREVPSQVAFFMDSTYSFGGKTYRNFGLVRTKDTSETTIVELDVPSTLVSRLLLRFMQRAATPNVINRPIDFRELSPKDYNPLLQDLRDLLSGGLPPGMTIDLTQVRQPDGPWTLAKDQGDSAVVLLDQLRAYPQIDYDVKRLADAIGRARNIFATVKDKQAAADAKPHNVLLPEDRALTFVAQ